MNGNILTLRKYKTHYFSKEDAEKIIENETYLNRKLAFQIAYDTGARVGEMVKISAEHFDFDRGVMTLWDSKKKSWKIVPLSEKTLNMAKGYLRVSKIKTRLFDVSERTLNNWLKWACKRENIKAEPGTKIRWHSWRGTFIRLNRDKGDKWLMQITGDSYLTILSYYQEHTIQDLKKIKDGKV